MPLFSPQLEETTIDMRKSAVSEKFAAIKEAKKVVICGG